MKRTLVLLAFLAACETGDSGSGPGSGDAGGSGSGSGSGSATPDAAVAHVHAVTCPTPAAPVVTTTDAGMSYMPSTTTIAVNGIVHFQMSPSHNVAPDPFNPSDPGLKVGFGEDKCLQFDTAGSYKYICSTHSFSGIITVQ